MKPVSFATLLNKSVIVPAPFKTHLAVEKHFLANRLHNYISSIFLDAKWYFDTYPDVKAAFGKRGPPGAKEHFVKFGYFEHRMPYFIQIDEPWYCSKHEDVERAVSEQRFPNGQAHFEALGYAEGRLPYPGFTLEVAEPA